MPELSGEQLARWQRILEAQTGINLTQHEHILREALQPWLQEIGAESDPEQVLRDSESRLSMGIGRSLLDHLSVKETRFYRNPAAFRTFSQYLMRRVKTAQPSGPIDIWSAGCATGEEVYTLAMIAADVIAGAGSEAYFGVIGTDLSSAALQTARLARYSARALRHLPNGLRERYFEPAPDGRFEVEPSIRERVCFLQSNLLNRRSAPASPMDVIFCHNVLVYFRSWRQKEVLDNLVARLRPGGILLIGPGEASGWTHPDVRRILDGEVQVFLRDTDNHSKQSREP